MILRIAMLALILVPYSATADEKYVGIFWNIQSGNSSADTIARNMAEKGAVDFWGLSEVPSSTTFLKTLEAKIEQRTGIDYVVRRSKSGDEDRLAILFRSDRLKAVPYSGNLPASEMVNLGGNFFELPEVNTSGTVRPSLGVQLKAGNENVIVLVNHWKAKGDDRSLGIRDDQAEETNRFIRLTPGIPIVVGGDHNIPIRNGGQGAQQRAFSTMTRKAKYLAPTNGTKAGSFRSGSLLDSVFLGNDHPGYKSKTTILNRVGNRAATTRSFRDNRKTADHRPLRILVTSDSDARIESLRDEIALLKRDLAAKERELDRLLDGQ